MTVFFEPAKLFCDLLRALVLTSMAAASLSMTASAQETFTITAVGTSLTSNAGWSGPLAKALEQCGLGAVRIVEIAKPGENSFWGITRLAEISQSRPDVVLIEYSANDARLWGGASLSDSRANVMKIAAAARQGRADARVILMAMSPAVGVRGWIRPWLNTYYDEYRVVAQAADFEFVDHRPAWHALGEQELYAAIPDGIHPTNASAASIIVPKLLAAILRGNC